MRDYEQRDRRYEEDTGEYAPREERDRFESEDEEPLFNRMPRVRVKVRRKFNDPQRNFKDMLQAFRRECGKVGVLRDFKKHQSYESKSSRRRRSTREARKNMLVESVKAKIVAGERVEGHGGVVKKVMAILRKEKEKERRRKERQAERQAERRHQGSPETNDRT